MPPASLGPIAQSLLEKRHPVRRPATDKALLAALLAKAKVPHHGPAIAFERDFGCLSFPDYGEGRSWQKSDVPAWLIGAAECLASDLTFRAPGKRKLVPVLYTTNDNVIYLDADGVAWGEDTIGDTALAIVASSARAMMARVLLGDHVFFCPEKKKVEASGARGKETAIALRLRAIREASDPAERWWSDGKTFVVERKGQTTIAYAPRGALAKLGIEVPKAARAPVGPVTFDSVMNEYAPAGVVVRLASTFEPACRAFFEKCAVERRVGASVSLADGAFVGTITAIDERPGPSLRIQLSLTGDEYVKKKSRVEVFFRDMAKITLMNVFQFGVKERSVDAIENKWRDEVIARLEILVC